MPETIQSSTEATDKPNEAVYDSSGFKEMIKNLGITGGSEKERQLQVCNMNPSELAVFITAVNNFSRNSDETDISNQTMKIGETPTIAPEDRADVFLSFSDNLGQARDISPERFGDSLALATVLLHPFSDGNGRTARLLGMVFRDNFDNNLEETFNTLSESRDIARERGGFLINGYIPFIGEQDSSNPDKVKEYLDKVLGSSDKEIYTGPYGQASLTTVDD